jgi:hypothetical protein
MTYSVLCTVLGRSMCVLYTRNPTAQYHHTRTRTGVYIYNKSILTIFGVDGMKNFLKICDFLRSLSYTALNYMPQTRACTNNNNPTSDDDILSRARRTVCQNVRPSVYITFFCRDRNDDDVLFKNKYCVFPLGSFVPHVPRPLYTYVRDRPRLGFPLYTVSTPRHRRFGHCRASFECEYRIYIYICIVVSDTHTHHICVCNMCIYA